MYDINIHIYNSICIYKLKHSFMIGDKMPQL